MDSETERIISKLDAPDITQAGSSLKFMLIAEGNAHFYPRLGPTMEWDTAAAQCILEEAGGSVIQLKTTLPVSYNKESLTNPSFLAIGALLDPEALQDIYSY
jgi:3'(2'), 5'-bisphosphate nucleotidase